MKSRMIKLATGTAALLLLSTGANATLNTDKVTLKGNMVVKYNKVPQPVDTLTEAFSEGMFYGRFRTNFFYWDWKTEYDGKTKDNKNNGVGGSLIYKTAPFKNISATVGMYTSQNLDFFRMDKEDIKYAKSGKDTFSRYNVATGGHYGMTVLAQAYLQYDVTKKSKVVLGRQMFETVFTKSNDTKMIPNTFDGATATIKDLPKTTIKLGYLAKQKLRDHTTSHDVLAYTPDDPTTSYNDSWDGNDDSAINKNLTVDRIGDDNKLLVASITNKSIKNLKANVSYAAVPGVLSNLVLEAHYAIPVGSMKIVPGVRYMMQFDDLGANYGVANLKGNQDGYTDPNSLDTDLLCARVDFKQGAFLGRLGYSKVADKADIVAPWRGFPTGGFTRAMAQYNWYANTKTYMLRLGYDFGKANILPGFSIMGRYAIQDFDENKAGVAADSNVIHIDLRQNIAKNSELKFRFGSVSADEKAGKDYSYNEYRLEYNYFF